MIAKILLATFAIAAYIVVVWLVMLWALWRVSDPDMTWWGHQCWQHPIRTLVMAVRILVHILRG